MDWHLFFQSLSDNDHGSQDEPLLPHSSILLTPFTIKDDIHVGGVHISRSESVLLAGASSIAYLSSVATTSFSLPGWLDTQPFCHPLAQALAISLTFITGHKCGYAINIPNHISLDQLTEAQKQLAGLELPLITSGNRCNHIAPSDPDYNQYISALCQLTEFLRSPQLEPKYREQILRSMELVARAISLQQDDHGLALSLTVAAIEAAATVRYDGLTPEDFFIQQEKEEVERFSGFVHSLRNDHPAIYKQHKSAIKRIVSRTIEFFENKHYSTRKFICFVENYAPYGTWDSLARHPWFDLPGGEYLIHAEPPWSQQPSRLPDEDLQKLLRDTYRYRSNYVHSALQPPGSGPSTTSTYFEMIVDWNTGNATRVIKLALLFGIARKCLLAWLVNRISISGET
jgi:hypothetical protein